MDQIEEVRSKTDIVELINEYVSLKKSGRSFRALCPFHSETKPSFFVSPELQIFKCFGCGKSGSVFNFLMEMEGMTFGEALRHLAKKAGVKLKPIRPTGEEKERQLLYEINHLASEFYHYILTQHQAGKKALWYAKIKRAISLSSIKTFKLGYAPQMWDGLIQFLVEKKGYRSEDLEKAGLVIRTRKTKAGRHNFYDRFRGRLMFPLFDHRGNVRGFAGRVIEEKDDTPKYINTPETPIYHKSNLLYGLETTRVEIKKKNLAIVVEGEIDAIVSYQAGVRNVVAIKGSALTRDHVSLLKRFCDNLALALDFDIAGDEAAKRGIEIADEAGFNLRMIRPLVGKDPDECVRKSAKLWRESVKKAVSIWDFYLDAAFERYGGKTAEAKKKIGEELMPVFARISNEIVKAHYIKILARRLEVNEEVIIKEMAKVKKRATIKPFFDKPKPTRKSRRELLEEYLLALLVRKKLLLLPKVKITTPVIKRILSRMKKKKRFSHDSFYKQLPEELKETFSRLYLQDLGEIDLEQEINQTVKELKKMALREKLKELAKKGDLEKFKLFSTKLKDLEV